MAVGFLAGLGPTTRSLSAIAHGRIVYTRNDTRPSYRCTSKRGHAHVSIPGGQVDASVALPDAERLRFVAPPGRRPAHASTLRGGPGRASTCRRCLSPRTFRAWPRQKEAIPTPPLRERGMPAPPQATIACCDAPPVCCISRRWPCSRVLQEVDLPSLQEGPRPRSNMQLMPATARLPAVPAIPTPPLYTGAMPKPRLHDGPCPQLRQQPLPVAALFLPVAFLGRWHTKISPSDRCLPLCASLSQPFRWGFMPSLLHQEGAVPTPPLNEGHVHDTPETATCRRAPPACKGLFSTCHAFTGNVTCRSTPLGFCISREGHALAFLPGGGYASRLPPTGVLPTLPASCRLAPPA